MDLKILDGAIRSLVIRISAAVLIFGSNVILARLMPAGDFGLYNYLLVSIGFIALLMQMGFDKSAIRFVPNYIATERPDRSRAFVHWANRYMLIVSPAAVLVTISACGFGGLGSGNWIVFAAASVTVVMFAYLQFWQQIERAFKHIVRSQIIEQIWLPAAIVLWLMLSWTAGISIDVASVMVAYAGIVAAGFLYLRSDVNKRLALEPAGTPTRKTSPEPVEALSWRRVSLPLAIGGLLSYFLIRGEIILMGWMLPPEDIAGYAVALRVANLMIFGLSAVTAIGGPTFSELFFTKNISGLQKAVSVSAALAILLSVPVLVVALAAPQFVMSIFGNGYLFGATALQILVIANFINVMVGPVAVLLSVTGEERFYVRSLAIIALIKALLIVPGALFYGVNGVALASAMCTILWTIWLAHGVHRRLGVVALPVFARRRD